MFNPETNHPFYPSLLVLGALAGLKTVTLCPRDVHTHQNAKTSYCSSYYKVSHLEAKMASWNTTHALNEGFYFA